MKSLAISMMMMMSLSSAFAGTTKEFDETTERNCHEQVRKLGCVNSDDQENKACVEAKKMKLPKECRELHEEKSK